MNLNAMISIDGGESRRCNLFVDHDVRMGPRSGNVVQAAVTTSWSVRVPGQLSPVVREAPVRIEVEHATLQGRVQVAEMGPGSFYLNGDGPLTEVSRG